MRRMKFKAGVYHYLFNSVHTYNGTWTNKHNVYKSLRHPESMSIASSPCFLADLPPLVIPKDGNLQRFGVDEMAAFFRYMNVNEEIVQRLHRKELDGRKFGKLKDKTLEDLQIKNPIILHFRDRSNKDKIGFML